jgi:gliding motility-associated-like protein
MNKNVTKLLFLFMFIILVSINAFAQVPSSNPMVCATAGGDGTTNINGSINTYFPPVANVSLAAGSKSINLSSVPAIDAYGNSFGTIAIKSGDLLLIIQTQDAVINYTNSTSYGGNNSTGGADNLGATGFTSLGSSGKFEYVMATNDIPLTGGILQFTGSGTGGGTVYTYTNADASSTRGKQSFQVIRIPQYANLRLTSNISPPPFNGKAGGIIAFEVSGNMDFNGFTIDVSARGFRGGYSLIKNAVTNLNDLYVTVATDDRASGKGEGIAGTPRYMWDGFNEVDNVIEGLPGGSAGRGAPANAGGGGNDTNAGGGGGGNGDNGGVGAWGYEPFGGTFPSGGRPGSKSYTNASPDDATRLIMGGGGGGGHANDALTGVKGGVGGGVVIINSRTISGSGTILANGAAGAPGVYGSHPDGSGGGGAGGSVFLKVSNPSSTANITVEAKGGKGGNTEGDSPALGVQPHGPGGGGGGGIIFYNIPSGQFHSDVSGGAPGKTDSGNGITHNAEGGLGGKVLPLDVNALPPYLKGNNSICFPLLTTTLSVVDAATPKLVNGTVTYIVKISNDPSAGSAAGVQADCQLPTGFSYKSATATFSGAATGPATITNTGTAIRPLMGDFIVPASGSVTITLVVDIGCVASGTYNSSAQAVYFDPTRDYTSPNRRITPKTNAFAGSNAIYQTTSFGNVGGSNYNGNVSTADDAIVTNATVTGNTIGQTTTDPTFCVSGAPSVIVGNIPSGGSGTYTYQWQVSNDNTTFTNIAGAILKDYNPPVINTTTYYRRAVISTSCATPILSNTITIAVQPALSNNKITAPIVSIFCGSGDALTITGNLPSGGDGNYTYTWQTSADNINFFNITGANAINYDPGVINSTTYFRRVVASAVCATPLLSNVVTITVQPVLANNAITGPLNTIFCSTGDAASIIGSMPTGGDGTYLYSWQKSTDNNTFTDIQGVIGKDYDPVATNVTTYYRREIISGGCTLPVVSNTVIIKIEPALAANTISAPFINVFCNSGVDPAAINGSIPTGGNGSYSYQWQSSTDNLTFTDITGAQSQSYDPSLINVTTYFRRAISSDVCSVPLLSNVVAIKIQTDAAISNNTITPPALTTVCKNGDPAVITGRVPMGGAGVYTYQWQSSTDNITFTDIATATSVNFDPTAIVTDMFYRRVVSSGQCVIPLVSNVVGIKIQPSLSNNLITPPALTTFCASGDGGLITGNVPAGGDGIYGYQWQSSIDNTNFTDIIGATSKDFDPISTAVTTYYRRMVTSGSCTTPLISNVLVITIQPAISDNVITVPTLTTFCTTGDAATLEGNVPVGGSGVYSYQWQLSMDNISFIDIAGANAKDYDPPVKNSTTYYRRLVTSGICSVPLVSNTIAITIAVPPLVPVLVDASPSVCPGSKATFQISLPQTGINYNWYSSANRTGLLHTGTSYLTDNLFVAKTYFVEASNTICISPLAIAQVSMAPAPTAPVLVKSSVSVCVGTAAALEIANAQNGFIYNWYSSLLGGTPVHVGNSFITPVIQATTTYYAEAVNTGGCTSDTRTAATVTPIALPTVTANDVEICPGATAVLTAIGTNADDQILWYNSVTGITPLQSGLSKIFTTQPLNSATDFYIEVINSNSCETPARFKVSVKMLQQLDAPVVTVYHTTTSSITFKWDEVTGAKGYQVSIDGGQTFMEPSSGSGGLTHIVTGLQIDQKITILVQAVGISTCQLSGSSTAVTGSAISEFNQVYVANAFTPNGDGNNDVLYVHGERIKTLSFYVYDQWGELLFTSTDIKKGWDGYYKGTREPVGVYVYSLKAIMNDGAQLNKKGTITLLR